MPVTTDGTVIDEAEDNLAQKDLIKNVSKEVKNLHEAFQKTNADLHTAQKELERQVKENGGEQASTAQLVAKLEKQHGDQLKELEEKNVNLAKRYEEVAKILEEIEGKSKKGAGVQREMKTVTNLLDTDMGKKWLEWDCDGHTVTNGKLKLSEIGCKGWEDLVCDRSSGFTQRMESKAEGITGSTGLRNVLSTRLISTIHGRPLLRSEHLRDHMTIIPATDLARIEWIERVGFTNNADYQDGEGAEKPLSGLEYNEHQATAKTLAHGIPISKQLYRHVPYMRREIESHLIDGLYHVEDDKILNSSGLNNSILGITLHERIQKYRNHPMAYFGGPSDPRALGDGQPADTRIDTLRRSMTMMRATYLTANLIVTNIYDWERIQLLKDADRRYLWVSVQVGGTPLMWQLPVFATDAMPVGYFLTGAFDTGATLWETDKANLQMFNQHKDWALTNMLLMLAEMEHFLSVEVPEAFCFGAFEGTPGSGSGS